MAATAGSSSSATEPAATVSVLFVCLGNICRSPMAHAVLAHLVSSLPPTSPPFKIDSAGTGAYHSHAPPDPRTTQTLRAHNITNFAHAARKVRASDFTEFDYILAMDEDNLEDLRETERRVREKGGSAKVRLFGDYGGRGREVVEDPYYGGGKGFEVAYEQCVRMGRGFLTEVVGEEGK